MTKRKDAGSIPATSTISFHNKINKKTSEPERVDVFLVYEEKEKVAPATHRRCGGHVCSSIMIQK